MSFRRIPSYARRTGSGNRKDLQHTLIASGLGVSLGGYYLLHLEQNAAGRYRFIDVSLDSELQAGNEAFQSMLHQYSRSILPSHHPTTTYVRDVARRIISASRILHPHTASFDWQVFVIHSPTKNAMVLPGGKIFVFDGLLPITKNRDGLAAVIGHECAHQYLRHSGERMSFMKVFIAIGVALQAVGVDFGISHALLKLVLELPNSRKAEYEADRVGMDVAARACFDPEEAIRVWQRMSQAEGQAGMDFLSTHPGHENRIEKLREFLPKAQKVYDSSECPQLSSFRSTFANAFA
ncbi:hypothetical protein E3P99_03006 [Wallemia hederae]|uniref:Peptidase M48 domain-containing protein n=1 Tax=Wallemia hederae TaxID=1540922 RepID=A0A4T0FHZ0_9BASI|nr:hypothetical protein E3P99_03006 [Wallemia hederae]